MSKAKFSDDFKRDAVHQITERGYPVAEVSQRLGVSQHSLYAWKRKFSKSPNGVVDFKTADGENDRRGRVKLGASRVS